MEQRLEQRQHDRELVRIPGTLSDSTGLLRVPFDLINLSRAGAMVEFSEDASIPDESILLFKHSSEPSRLVWRDGRLAGFQFIDHLEV